MTRAQLREYTCKDLAQLAKKIKVPGWHSMRKEELVAALSRHYRDHANKSKRTAPRRSGKSGSVSTAKSTKSSSPPADSNRMPSRNNTRPSSPTRSAISRTSRRINQMQSQLQNTKNIGSQQNGRGFQDRLVVMVRDPYWLHAYWEITLHSIRRAQAALAQHWHGAVPILRLFASCDDGSAKPIRDIQIHGGVSNWYIDVVNPPQTYRLEIGYRSSDDVFFCLARSNEVSTPAADTSDAVDENWVDVAENADRIFAMSGGYSRQGTSKELQELLEERLRRPLGSPMTTRFGAGAHLAQASEFQLAVDAEAIVYGMSSPGAHVTLQGEPVQLRSDGSFAVRLNLPERRAVIPIVACSGDGVEQRTVVLAVERNTKVMEPVIRDATAR